VKTFDLETVTASQLASAILGTTSPADFLSNGEAITAAYTANVDYKNATIVLEGEFSFEVAGTKASLLSKFDDAIEDITVADIVRTGDNITVTFADDVAISAVKDAANGLIEALRQIADGSSTLTVAGQTFDLK
jgi:hypothetical protein